VRGESRGIGPPIGIHFCDEQVARHLFARSSACSEVLAAEVGEKPKEQAYADAEDQAGHDREIEGGVLATMDDVAGETAEAEGQFTAEVEKSAGDNQHCAQEK
jgi:hypothetical protein